MLLCNEKKDYTVFEFTEGKKWTEKQRLASIEYFKKHPKRKVYKYTQKGELVAEFSSCQEAAIDAGVHKNTIYQKLHSLVKYQNLFLRIFYIFY